MRSSQYIREQQREFNSGQNQTTGHDLGCQPGKIFVVGIGPGDPEHMTVRVQQIWQEAEVIAGYITYVELIRSSLQGQPVVTTGMRHEVERCREVVRLAETGKKVALISSGDAGVYGMAGILLECLERAGRLDIPVEIVPGITAASAASSMLGAPLMHDFAVISLSDLLTPWELIRKRVDLVAQGDFVLAIYNPKSKGRTRQIEEVREIMLQHRAASTPVGLVREALRGEESVVVISDLEHFASETIDMLTTVIIGNSQTRVIGDYMVTPRGYPL